jgi:hypothetical protein
VGLKDNRFVRIALALLITAVGVTGVVVAIAERADAAQPRVTCQDPAGQSRG